MIEAHQMLDKRGIDRMTSFDLPNRALDNIVKQNCCAIMPKHSYYYYLF